MKKQYISLIIVTLFLILGMVGIGVYSSRSQSSVSHTNLFVNDTMGIVDPMIIENKIAYMEPPADDMAIFIHAIPSEEFTEELPETDWLLLTFNPEEYQMDIDSNLDLPEDELQELAQPYYDEQDWTEAAVTIIDGAFRFSSDS